MTRRRVLGLAALLLIAMGAAYGGPAVAQPCVGDCNDDGLVQINELILGVNIALDLVDLSECPSLDNGQGMVTVDRLIAAVNSALCDCALCPTPPPGTATPTVTPETATPTPTGGEVVSMWTVDDYNVESSDCNGRIEDAVLRGLQEGGSEFTVRQAGDVAEIEDGEGNLFSGTTDPDGTVRVERTESGSIATCDYDVRVDAFANLSESPTTATYDGDVNLSGFCPGFSDCSMRITSSWTRVEGAAARN